MDVQRISGDFTVVNEAETIARFVDVVNNVIRTKGSSTPMSDKTALKFLLARKFDIRRALELYQAHEITRLREGLGVIDVEDENLKAELNSQKFTILKTRDSNNSMIALFRARLHQPDKSNLRDAIHRYTLQGIVYQLDAALEDVITQRNGIVFIYDMTDSDLSNFDMELCKKILNLLKGAYPARLKKVLVVSSPMWFKVVFKLLGVIVKEKLRERVELLSINQLQTYIPLESLPPEFGGSYDHDHLEWLEKCQQLHSNRTNDLCDPDFAQTLIKNSSKNGSINDNNITNLINIDDRATTPTTISAINNNNNNNVTAQESTSCNNNNFSEITSNPSGTNSSSSSIRPTIDLKSIVPQYADLLGLEPTIERITKPQKYDYDEDGMSLSQFIKMIKMNGNKGLGYEYEYTIVENERVGSFSVSTSPKNMCKNRYINVKCYDHSRVILEPYDLSDDQPAPDRSSDYINANWVDGYRQPKAYISTQGPTETTLVDFWRMMWQTSSRVIAMVTLNIENNMLKCDKYWPSSDDRVIIAGVYTIEYIGVEYCQDYIISHLKLTNTKSEVSRDIYHMQFISWPDFGTPQTATALLKYRQNVLAKQSAAIEACGGSTYPPIVVHCSAGVGRSGTFITIDICIQKLETTGLVDVKGVVVKLREQRYLSVQTRDQYIFCYKSVFEYALSCGLLKDEQEEDLDNLFN